MLSSFLANSSMRSPPSKKARQFSRIFHEYDSEQHQNGQPLLSVHKNLFIGRLVGHGRDNARVLKGVSFSVPEKCGCSRSFSRRSTSFALQAKVALVQRDEESGFFRLRYLRVYIG